VIHVKMSEKQKIDIRKIDTAMSDKTPDGARPQVNDNCLVPYPDKMTGCGPSALGNGRTGTDGDVTHGVSSL